MHLKRSLVPCALVALIGASAAPARADTLALVDFSTGLGGGGGTVSYAGGASPLIGTGIRIGVVTGFDTLLNHDAHLVTGGSLPYGILNFTTGAFTGFSAGAYSFGSGGSFQLYGNVPDAGVSALGAGALLVSGAFGSASIQRNPAGLDLFTATGVDTFANPLFASFFSVPSTASFEFWSFIAATGPMEGGDPFSVTAFSTDWVNVDPIETSLAGEGLPAAIPTPEPGGLLLFGSGLALLGAVKRRVSGFFRQGEADRSAQL